MLSITLHVDDDAAAGGDGSSWATAYNNLQSALAYASNPANDVDAIWIAEGTYKPTAELEPGDARSASFSLIDGVTLYGGFVGDETTLGQRDLSAGHTTILSGDLGVLDDTSDNAYTVVYCSAEIEASLNGLTITGGYADETYDLEKGSGGGIYNFGTMTIVNCTISNNSASNRGGGIMNGNMTTVINCTFIDNFASYGGGIANAYNYNTLIVTNSTFTNNSGFFGGGIYNYSKCSLTITGSTITGNLGNIAGGGIFNMGAMNANNCTIVSNTSNYNAGGIAHDGGSVIVLNNTIVAANGAPNFPDILVNELSGSHNLIGDGTGQSDLVHGVDGNLVGTSASPIDPMFVDPTGGNYRLDTGSPAIDAGDNSLIPSGTITDLDGNYRITNGTVDMGAYEYGSTPLLDGDANGDGKVDIFDNGFLVTNWQAGVPNGNTANVTWQMGDFNHDGKVDSSDLAIMANNWQTTVSLSPLKITKLFTLKAEPEETTVQYTPPASALLAVATVPLQETLPPRHWVIPAATDAILAGSLEPIEDFTAIARDIAASSAKDVHDTEPELEVLELDLYDNFE